MMHYKINYSNKSKISQTTAKISSVITNRQNKDAVFCHFIIIYNYLNGNVSYYFRKFLQVDIVIGNIFNINRKIEIRQL